jgi:hypothetical protein
MHVCICSNVIHRPFGVGLERNGKTTGSRSERQRAHHHHHHDDTPHGKLWPASMEMGAHGLSQSARWSAVVCSSEPMRHPIHSSSLGCVHCTYWEILREFAGFRLSNIVPIVFSLRRFIVRMVTSPQHNQTPSACISNVLVCPGVCTCVSKDSWSTY